MEKTDNPAPGFLGGTTCTIRPGVPCPATVLVAVLSNGGYLLVGYPEGEPAALIAAEDADLLRQGLDGAFGHPDGTSASGDRTVAPGNEVMGTKKVQP